MKKAPFWTKEDFVYNNRNGKRYFSVYKLLKSTFIEYLFPNRNHNSQLLLKQY